ncbi:FtsL-like putative cell division protein [Hallella sp.]|uniref:FtsL-like putative cell division protein n=1 Tax=Hallella sp. TaxID=2980186 RepID=UPI003078B092
MTENNTNIQDDKEKPIDSKPLEELTLKEVIEETATEDEAPQSRMFSLRKILGGDILSAAIIRRQVWLILLIVFFMIIYVSNRYSCQQDIIEIDKLHQQLTDAKYKALSSESELTELSRESNVLEMLKDNKDSVLKIASQPPYFIEIPNGQ